MRVARVDDQRNPHGPKTAPCEFRTVLGSRCRHARAHHVRKVHAAFFDDITLGQNPADAAATLRSIPGLGGESCAAIDGLEFPADLILK